VIWLKEFGIQVTRLLGSAVSARVSEKENSHRPFRVYWADRYILFSLTSSIFFWPCTRTGLAQEVKVKLKLFSYVGVFYEDTSNLK
jgi:hypothetical protein